MDKARASYLNTAILCGAAGVSLAALVVVGVLSRRLRLLGRTVISADNLVSWYAFLFLVLALAVYLLLVALGGTICIFRDIEDNRGSRGVEGGA